MQAHTSRVRKASVSMATSGRVTGSVWEQKSSAAKIKDLSQRLLFCVCQISHLSSLLSWQSAIGTVHFDARVGQHQAFHTPETVHFDKRVSHSQDSLSKMKKKEDLKQNWLPAFRKKIQNTQEIKRTLFNWTKQDKTCKFSRKSSFSSYVQHHVSLVHFSFCQPPTSN